MALITNFNGGRVCAEGKSLEVLLRAGWVEVVPPQPAPVKAELPKGLSEVINTTDKAEKVTPAPKRTRRTKTTTDK